MSSYDLENGFDLAGKIIMKLNEKGKYKEINEVTFLVFDCQSHEDLDLIKTHPITKNIILVGDLKSTEPNIINLSRKFWNDNKEELYCKTKNSFVVHGKPESALEETYSTLTEYSKFYPIVLFYSQEDINKKEIGTSGYSSQKQDDFVCCVNKNLRSFKSYETDKFGEIEETKEEPKNSVRKSFRVSGKGTEVPISIRKNKSDETSLAKESGSDFSFLDDLIYPTHEMELNKYNVPTSKQWWQQFYEYLRDLLTRIFPKDRTGLVDLILTKETLKTYWLACFTHVTANPNGNKNYEALESLGDKTMGYCFKFYVKFKEPGADASRINNLDQKYMSKDFQSKLAKSMYLNKWLIADKSLSDRMDVTEDILEAFCGTIDVLLYMRKGSLGLGVIMIYNLMKLLFDDVTFTSEKAISSDPAVTYVQQYFSGQAFRIIEKQQYTNLRKPKEIPDKIWTSIVKDMNKILDKNDISPVIIKEDKESHRGIVEDAKLLPDGKTKYTIKLMKTYADIVKNYGIKLSGQGDIVLGQYISNTNKVAKKVAYERAKKFLEDHGMTKEWKDGVNEKKKSSLIQRKDIAFEKAKKKYPNLVGELVVERGKEITVNGKKATLYQLQGTESDGTIVPIYSVVTQDSNYTQGIIDEYLDQ